ncbi:MAG: hypothetical protein AB7E49_02445 [Campylobacterales bacterium]
MFAIPLLLSILLITTSLFAAENKILTPIPAAPLEMALFDAASLPLQIMQLNNWLSEHHQTVTDQAQARRIREDVFLLIDAYARNLYHSSRKTMPEGADLQLSQLFMWGHRFGAYGAPDIYNALKAPERPMLSAGRDLPKGLSLSLEEDRLALSSKSGWTLRIPYFFMIWHIDNSLNNAGMQTEMVVFSTGFAPDRLSPSGLSQSTVMLMFAPGTPCEAFNDFWLERLSIKTQKTEIDNFDGVEGYLAEGEHGPHRLFWSQKNQKGCLGLAYTGMEGPFRHNWPYLNDIVQQVNLGAARNGQ